jgi:taurine dioxygenase
VFRDQQLGPDDQIRALEVFGNVLDEKGDSKRYQYVSGYDTSIRPGRLLFHSDNHFTPVPLEVLSLYAENVDASAAPTLFCDNVRAFRRLPKDLADKLAGAQVATRSFFHLGYSDQASRTLPAELSGGPEAVHPAIWTHPQTGESYVYLTELHANHIVGMDQEESDRLLDAVFAAIYDEANLYEHKWRPGDLVIWNNRTVQHARGEVPEAAGPGEKSRVVRRVAVGPIGFSDQFQFSAQAVEDMKRGFYARDGADKR